MKAAFFFGVSSILALLCCCILGQTYKYPHCEILKPSLEAWNKMNYIITATAGSYSVNALCRCYTGSPNWRYGRVNEEGKYKILDSPKHCLNNGQECYAAEYEVIENYNSSYFFYRNLTNYVINETTVLICGNNYNYAKALSIIIDQPQKNCSDNEALSSSNSLISSIQPTPSVSASSSQLTTQLTASNDVTMSNSFFWSEMSSFACTTDTTTVTTIITITQPTMYTLSSSTSTASFTSPPTIVERQIEDCKSSRDINIYLGAACGFMLLVIVALIILLVFTCIKPNRRLNNDKEPVPGLTCIENNSSIQEDAQNPANTDD